MRFIIACLCLSFAAKPAGFGADRMPLTEMLAEHLPQLRLASLLPLPAAVNPQASEPADTPEDDDDTAQDKRQPNAEVPLDEVCETLAAAAQAHGLPVPFFARLIWQESKFNHTRRQPRRRAGRGAIHAEGRSPARTGKSVRPDRGACRVSARFLQCALPHVRQSRPGGGGL